MSLFTNKALGSFGSSTTQNQNGPGLFGVPAQPQSQAQASLFGNSTTTQPPSTSLFGTTSTSQPQQQSNLFGASLGKSDQSTSVFGTTQSNLPSQGGGIFSGSSSQQKPNIFGTLGQGTQQQNQQSSLQQQNVGFSQQAASRIWSEQQTPRQKSVGEQIALIYQKWQPNSPSSSFHTYMYNIVPPEAAPFFRPDLSDSEEKWEEALREAPGPGHIPILIKGFEQLGHRIVGQEQTMRTLRGRLHEINSGLSDLLRRHDLEVSTRAAECKRKHIRLSQKCLSLATKTQILRNRGYALDVAEEELAQKLKKLERQVLDPALNSRGEEIWARMVNVRERSRWLQSEFEKTGNTMDNTKGRAIDDEVLKQASKILEDYDKQLTHLATELKQIRLDFMDWESSKLGGRSQTNSTKDK